MKLGCSSKLSCYHHLAQLLCLRTRETFMRREKLTYFIAGQVYTFLVPHLLVECVFDLSLLHHLKLFLDLIWIDIPLACLILNPHRSRRNITPRVIHTTVEASLPHTKLPRFQLTNQITSFHTICVLVTYTCLYLPRWRCLYLWCHRLRVILKLPRRDVCKRSAIVLSTVNGSVSCSHLPIIASLW